MIPTALRLRIVGFGLRITVGNRTRNPQSSEPAVRTRLNPQSAIRNPQSQIRNRCNPQSRSEAEIRRRRTQIRNPGGTFDRKPKFRA